MARIQKPQNFSGKHGWSLDRLATHAQFRDPQDTHGRAAGQRPKSSPIPS